MNISKLQRGYGTSVLSLYATHQYISILKVTPSKRVRYVINTCLKKNVIDTCLKKKNRIKYNRGKMFNYMHSYM